MKMLIISFYFPPCTDGAATLMYNLCKYLPKECFTVITASEELGKSIWNNLGAYDKEYVVDCDTIRLPVRTNILKDRVKFFFLTIMQGLILSSKERVDTLLAVYPDEFDLFAAYFLHMLTGKPLVIYMHDLYTEVRKKARLYPFWKFIEKEIFSSASAILVTNEKFRDYYERKGVKKTVIFHSCVDLKGGTLQNHSQREEGDKRKLRLVFTGSIYGANQDTIATFLKAIRKMHDVEVIFATPSKADLLRGVSVGFLAKNQCADLQRSADVLFLPLSFNDLIREEVECAFPCKVLEYLAAGKPILAVVPEESYVKKLITKYDVGLVVTELSEMKIVEAIERLKDRRRRLYYSNNASKTALLFEASIQSKRLYKYIKDIGALREHDKTCDIYQHAQ